MEQHHSLLKQLSGCRSAKEIAALYFPQYNHPGSRLEAFRRSIMETPGMYARMKSKCYTDHCEFMTPHLIAIIIEFWGWPDEIVALLETGMTVGKSQKE